MKNIDWEECFVFGSFVLMLVFASILWLSKIPA